VLIVLPPTLLLWERFFGDEDVTDSTESVLQFGTEQPGDN
jgi:hypothetical protein